ncbi:LPXTG cell wall anchor domain-containing protein [Streptomyces sp. NPDC047971]|uniref:LPXTG cell wall anchor domain-containing protein n=1 Tax=Streptomyces sp. NPDC047971 TaxID=3154499 RepID=UPI0033EEB138
MRRSLIPAGALVAAVAGSLVLAPAASASDSPQVLPLHQAKDLPLTADEFGTQEKTCADIPATKDGWHFVLPGSGKGENAVFTKLTVEFQPGGVQTITVFGPPSDKHAYVSSEPGAKLISATAEVKGKFKKEWFNLSHTCPSTTEPTPTGTPSTSTSPSGTPSGTPSETPSESATSGTPGTSATPSATDSASAGATPSASTSAATGGDLAETGSSAPVGIIAAAAVALAGAGAFMVTRRRKAQQH